MKPAGDVLSLVVQKLYVDLFVALDECHAARRTVRVGVWKEAARAIRYMLRCIGADYTEKGVPSRFVRDYTFTIEWPSERVDVFVTDTYAGNKARMTDAYWEPARHAPVDAMSRPRARLRLRHLAIELLCGSAGHGRAGNARERRYTV
jgi:hypothetical protein